MTRRAREETATVQTNIEACMDAFVLTSAVHTAAVEHYTNMNAAQRVTTRTSWSWELDMKQAAVDSQEMDSARVIESALADWISTEGCEDVVF